MSKSVQLQGASPPDPLTRGFALGPHWGHAPRPPYRLALPRSPWVPLALVTCGTALAVPWFEKLSGAATAANVPNLSVGKVNGYPRWKDNHWNYLESVNLKQMGVSGYDKHWISIQSHNYGNRILNAAEQRGVSTVSRTNVKPYFSFAMGQLLQFPRSFCQIEIKLI